MANVIEVVVKTTDNTKEGMESAGKRAGVLKGRLADVAASASGFLAGSVISSGINAFKNMLGGSIEAASDLGESINAVQQIFGKSAPTIIQWGEANAQSFGLSKRAFNEMATPLGAMLKNAGLSMQDTTKWTIDLTKRASDMASVFNTSVPDALAAIQAGLRGESDPLERYGVGLSAAKVEAAAMAETGKKSAKSLTDQEKATARLNLIMKQTSNTAGDFQNTSDGLANSQRIQQARMENLRAEIGQKLLPAKLALGKAETALAEIISAKVVPVLNRLSEWFSEHPAAVKAVAIAVGVVLVAAFVAWAASAAAAAAATIAATWPILAIVAVVAALAAGLIYAYKHWGWFKDQVDANAKFLRDVAWPVFRTVAVWIGKTFVKYLEILGIAFATLAQAALTAFGIILHAAAVSFGWIPGIGNKLKAADAAFGSFRNSVNAKLNSIKKDLTVRVRGDSSHVDRVINNVNQRLALINGRTVWINVAANNANAREGRAGGGIVGAAGGGIRSRQIMAGEYGPELIDLPSGSNVHSNPDTMRALTEPTGPMKIILEVVSGSGGEFERMLAEMMRKYVRVRGGNVQVVLGHGNVTS